MLSPSKHPNDNGPRHSILLDVNQELGERPHALVRPELAHPRCALEVGQQQDVKELGPDGRREGVDSLAEQLLELGDRRHSGTLLQRADVVASEASDL
jgi:hypothetical protein